MIDPYVERLRRYAGRAFAANSLPLPTHPYRTGPASVLPGGGHSSALRQLRLGVGSESKLDTQILTFDYERIRATDLRFGFATGAVVAADRRTRIDRHYTAGF